MALLPRLPKCASIASWIFLFSWALSERRKHCRSRGCPCLHLPAWVGEVGTAAGAVAGSLPGPLSGSVWKKRQIATPRPTRKGRGQSRRRQRKTGRRTMSSSASLGPCPRCRENHSSYFFVNMKNLHLSSLFPLPRVLHLRFRTFQTVHAKESQGRVVHASPATENGRKAADLSCKKMPT